MSLRGSVMLVTLVVGLVVLALGYLLDRGWLDGGPEIEADEPWWDRQ
ncbi:MAG TPA: hypothetical protein VG406_18405 [Isosphaeraceae bacterium]|jgi:hypothetical protein|nr:hypothetical protein [Isosphaeraceae bacterium]